MATRATRQRLDCHTLVPQFSRCHQLRPTPGQRPRLLRALKPGTATAFRGRLGLSGRRALLTVAAASGEAAPAAHGRNLMVAVDSSPDSHYACEWLINNVYTPGDTIHVVHCIPYYPRSGIYVMPDGRLATLDFDVLLRNEEQFLMAAEKAVADWCSDALERAQVRYVVDLLREQPGAEDKDVIGQAICNKARELQASVLVIASQAKSGLSEFFLGSVASYCAHHCDAPTLVLHQPRGEAQGTRRSWLADLAGLLQPKVTAVAVGAAAAGAAAAAREGGEDVFDNVVRLSEQEAAQRPSESGIISSTDLPTDEDNLFGQTADFPGIGSQAASAFEPHPPPEAAVAGAAAAPAAASTTEAGPADGGGGRHLVLAVDDSDASERAAMWAVANLYRPGDICHLMHIIPAMPYRATYGGPVMDGFLFYMEPPTEDFKKATELYVGKRFVNKLEALGIHPQVEIIMERAEDSVSGIGHAICRQVAELPGEVVVVVGSHTRGGLAEFMLGSVASYLTHHCPKPVAVLH